MEWIDDILGTNIVLGIWNLIPLRKIKNANPFSIFPSMRGRLVTRLRSRVRSDPPKFSTRVAVSDLTHLKNLKNNLLVLRGFYVPSGSQIWPISNTLFFSETQWNDRTFLEGVEKKAIVTMTGSWCYGLDDLSQPVSFVSTLDLLRQAKLAFDLIIEGNR